MFLYFLLETGGGGGAGGPGGAGNPTPQPDEAGDGGPGKLCPIDGLYYGAGGGGGAYHTVANYVKGVGGSSVGGDGGESALKPTDPVANSGSGGGGAGNNTGDATYRSYPSSQTDSRYGSHGASGRVIIRYLSP